MSYNSKYKGSEVEEKLDKVDQLNAGMVDADEELEEVNTLPFVKYVQQTLTDEQKAIARENIGVGNVSSSTPEIDHGTADTTLEIEPNVFHKWGEVASLSLSLGAEKEGVVNEFLFQFESGATATTLSLPDGIKWANDEAPTIESGKIYQVSIVGGLASALVFTTTVLIENKITCNGNDLTTSVTFTAAYPVESAITISYKVNGVARTPAVMSKGSSTLTVQDNTAIPVVITGISPSSDGMYLYTF